MRPRLLVAVFCLCVSSPLFAQTPDQPDDDAPPPSAQSIPQIKQPAPPPATAAITGTVFCSDTHRPARGAVVMAQPMPKSGRTEPNINTGTSRVGIDGTYTIQHLQPGDYTVVALLPGYLSPFDDLQVNQIEGDETQMRALLARNGIVSLRNNETARLDVTIARGATISGRVIYDDGAPATQVILNLEDVNAKPAPKPATTGNDDLDMSNMSAGVILRGFFLHQSQGTDDQGNFRISGIKPGTYRLAAAQPADTLTGGDGAGIIFGVIGDRKSVRIYAGNTLHKNAAKTYEPAPATTSLASTSLSPSTPSTAFRVSSPPSMAIPSFPAISRSPTHRMILSSSTPHPPGTETSSSLRSRQEPTSSPCQEHSSAHFPRTIRTPCRCRRRCCKMCKPSATRPPLSSSKTPTSPTSAFNCRASHPHPTNRHQLRLNRLATPHTSSGLYLTRNMILPRSCDAPASMSYAFRASSSGRTDPTLARIFLPSNISVILRSRAVVTSA